MLIHFQLSILCLFFAFEGISQSRSHMQLQGKWEVELSESDKSGMVTLLDKSFLEILADSTFTGSVLNKEIQGTWTTMKNRAILTPQKNEDGTPPIILDQIQNEKCTWIFDEKAGIKITMMKTLRFQNPVIEPFIFLPIKKSELVGSWTNTKLKGTQSTIEKNKFLFGVDPLNYPLLLNEDGSFIMERALVNVSKLTLLEGTWNIENNFLVLTDQKNGRETYGLILLQADKMILMDSKIQKTPLLGQDQLEYTFVR